jgi:signal transduction histidine kinase
VRRGGRARAGGWPRWTARLRLTLWYGGLFLLAGLVLVGTSFLLVRQRLGPQGEKVVCVQSGGGVATLPTCKHQAVGGAPVPGPIVAGQITDGQITAIQNEVLSIAMRTFLQTMLLTLALMALLSLGLGWVVAGRVLRPLQRITATAKRLSERNLHQRIALDGPDDELRELADTFDQMLARLDTAFDSQRRFVANASHELRTPLAITRAEVDVALADPDAPAAELRATAERVRDATDRSERLIEGLLTLAGSERELRAREPADLADSAAAALEHAQRGDGPGGLQLTTALRPAPVVGDAALLERMIANLVENAIRHNRPDGWVDVATGTGDGRAFVQVANGGPAIPADRVESLFEPFRRLEERVASLDRGAGLGLSIVRSVAHAHGGDVGARALSGGGLEVTIRLPTPTGDPQARPAPTAGAAQPTRARPGLPSSPA